MIKMNNSSKNFLITYDNKDEIILKLNLLGISGMKHLENINRLDFYNTYNILRILINFEGMYMFSNIGYNNLPDYDNIEDFEKELNIFKQMKTKKVKETILNEINYLTEKINKLKLKLQSINDK